MISSTAPARGFGAATAMALVLMIAAPGEGHAAEYRSAGHPHGVNAPSRPPMRPLQTGTVVARPAARATPRIAPPASPDVAERAGDQRRDRKAFVAGVTAGVIVVGVPSGYYDGAPTDYAPGSYGDQHTDGDPAVGPSPPLGDSGVAYCSQTYSSYDPQSGMYIGEEGNAYPCP